MEFVNIHGETVNTAASKEKKAAKPKANDAYHKGWIVTGHSPAQLESYKLALPASIPFNHLSFARTTKFLKVRVKPYESAGAAEACAQLAIREGWTDVEVRPVSKGV